MRGNPRSRRGWLYTGYEVRDRCERCSSCDRLVVHHRDRDQSNNIDHANLETLCYSCHQIEHVNERAPGRGQRIRVALKKYYTIFEHREALRRAHDNDETRARHSAANQARNDSAKFKALWADPDWRAKMLAARRNASSSFKAWETRRAKNANT